MKYFKVDNRFVDEEKLKEIALYYYNNSEVEEEIDFSILQNCIDFVKRADKVEEVEDMQLIELLEFKEHMLQTLDRFFQYMDENRDDELEPFEIKLNFCGKELIMPLNAEAFHHIQDLIQSEIEEF